MKNSQQTELSTHKLELTYFKLLKGELVAFGQSNQIVRGINNRQLHDGGKSNLIFPKYLVGCVTSTTPSTPTHTILSGLTMVTPTKSDVVSVKKEQMCDIQGKGEITEITLF